MRTWRICEVLTDEEMEIIHHYVLRILAEVGGIVQSQGILKKLEEYGAKVDYQNERVWFPEELMERFINESEPVSEEFDPTQIKIGAGTYGAFWMTPEGKVELFTEKTIKEYISLSLSLDNVDTFGMPIPHDMGHLKVSPLYMRLLWWKYVEPKEAAGSAQVQNHRLIPYIIEMAEVMADRFGGNVWDYVYGDIEFQSPFRCGREEARILEGLIERGFRCSIGGPMPAVGITTPVTLAGALTVHIAEIFFKLVISRVMYGLKTLNFSSSACIVDMKTGAFMRSRPENALFALAMGQMAHKKYKGYYRGPSFGVCDAQTPSVEAGFQNGMLVFTGIMAGSRYMGGLGVICQPTSIISPIQMIIDNECAGIVKRFIRGFDVNKETIAFDLIKEVIPYGSFLDKTHTVENFRKELWQPVIFNRDNYQKWALSNGKTDVEKAKEIYYEIVKNKDIIPKIDETTEKELLKIIHSAEKSLSI